MIRKRIAVSMLIWQLRRELLYIIIIIIHHRRHSDMEDVADIWSMIMQDFLGDIALLSWRNFVEGGCTVTVV